jgi:tungstate transport system substrate-binding protein
VFKKAKFWAIILVMLMMVSIIAGCTGQKQEPPKEEPKTGQQAAEPENQEVILATTTSTFDSGLLDVLQPEFEKQTGYKLTIVSVGSGAAIAMAERGEADVLLVHSPADEIRIADAGAAINRQLVMPMIRQVLRENRPGKPSRLLLAVSHYLFPAVMNRGPIKKNWVYGKKRG